MEFDPDGAESTLTINSVEQGDEGVYQCVVRNNGGMAIANELLVAESKSHGLVSVPLTFSFATHYSC